MSCDRSTSCDPVLKSFCERRLCLVIDLLVVVQTPLYFCLGRKGWPRLELAPTTNVCYNSLLWMCTTNVCYNSLLWMCTTNVCYNSLLWMCRTNVCYNSLLWMCTTNVCYNSFLWMCTLNPISSSSLLIDNAADISLGAIWSSVLRAFAHGAMGRRIDPSWCPIKLFLVPASAPRLV